MIASWYSPRCDWVVINPPPVVLRDTARFIWLSVQYPCGEIGELKSHIDRYGR